MQFSQSEQKIVVEYIDGDMNSGVKRTYIVDNSDEAYKLGRLMNAEWDMFPALVLDPPMKERLVIL